MASDRIEADYEVLEQVSTMFAQQGGDIEQMIQLVRKNVDQLQGEGWKGRGSEAFFAEMGDEIFPALERLRQALEEAGSTTKNVAQTLSQAEEEAANSFQIR